MRKKSKSAGTFIGVTPDLRKSSGFSALPGETMVFLVERYSRALLSQGGTPVILPITSSRREIEKILDRLEGLLVTGGNFDIPPQCYGEEPLQALGELKEERTEFELELISQALRRNIPILGVCGGEQAINVVLGGSLYQDIASQLPEALEHQQSTLKEQGGHHVQIHAGTELRRILRKPALEVNTSHHQAVKTLGKGLKVNATAEDSIIEGIESENFDFVVGVQWHPEFLAQKDAAQRRLFSAFISACAR